MQIEINVEWRVSKMVEVPAELAPDSDWNYPNREAFDRFVEQEADKLADEHIANLKGAGDDWAGTTAYEVENYSEVYDNGPA